VGWVAYQGQGAGATRLGADRNSRSRAKQDAEEDLEERYAGFFSEMPVTWVDEREVSRLSVAHLKYEVRYTPTVKSPERSISL